MSPRFAAIARWGALLIGLAALAVGLRFAGAAGAGFIEARLLMRAEAVLDGAGATGWARVSANGLTLSLEGTAPDPDERAFVLRALADTMPYTALRDATEMAPVPAERRPPVRLEIHRRPQRLTLTGQFADRAMRADLLIALGRTLPALTVEDLSGTGAAAPPPEWGPEIAVAVAAAAAVPEAYVRIEPGRILVEGVMPDEDTRAAVAADLRGRSGPALALTLALRVPRRVIAPFRFVAETRGSQAGLSVKSCALRSEEERVEILAVLAAAGARLPREGCAVGIGGPALPWAEAVLAGLAALTRLGEGPLLVGRLELSGASVLLSARVPAVAGPRSDGPGVPAREDEAAYEAALGALAATLPAGFLLDGRLIARAPADAAVGPAARFWLALGWEDGRLALSGRLPGPASRRAVMRLLSARLGQEAVSHDALRAEEATAPPGFEDAAVAAAEAMIGLSPTAEAEAVLTELGLTVQATVRSAEEAVRLQYALARSMPDGVALTTELTVDLPGALALRPLPPARCAHLANGAVTERPLRFDPGSARIEAESIAVLDRLAEILVRCEGARIEIGGHTDNQGSEGFNQRLSKARAESVLAGLRERGLGRDAVRLTAAGYGEAQPVASNRTPDGRARNRRIAFRLLDG